MSAEPSKKTWQKKRWVPIVAILLGYTLPLSVFIMQFVGGPTTGEGYLLYATIYTFLVLAVLLLLLRFLCGEKPSVLNLKTGTWWKDILGGLGLVAITLTMKITLDPMIGSFFYRASDVESGINSLMDTLTGNMWLFALFIGPVLFIGVAGSEEVTRMFFITRWMKIFPSKVWLGLGVFMSAALFGLNHIAQGPAGIISVALNGLVMMLWYLRFGRVFHLVIAHYLYDAIQIGLMVILIK